MGSVSECVMYWVRWMHGSKGVYMEGRNQWWIQRGGFGLERTPPFKANIKEKWVFSVVSRKWEWLGKNGPFIQVLDPPLTESAHVGLLNVVRHSKNPLNMGRL